MLVTFEEDTFECRVMFAVHWGGSVHGQMHIPMCSENVGEVECWCIGIGMRAAEFDYDF